MSDEISSKYHLDGCNSFCCTFQCECTDLSRTLCLAGNRKSHRLFPFIKIIQIRSTVLQQFDIPYRSPVLYLSKFIMCWEKKYEHSLMNHKRLATIRCFGSRNCGRAVYMCIDCGRAIMSRQRDCCCCDNILKYGA